MIDLSVILNKIFLPISKQRCLWLIAEALAQGTRWVGVKIYPLRVEAGLVDIIQRQIEWFWNFLLQSNP